VILKKKATWEVKTQTMTWQSSYLWLKTLALVSVKLPELKVK